MIIGNKIKFGHGDVAVMGDSLLERITFASMKPPLECGSRITSDMDVEFNEKIIINGDGTLDLYNLIKTVNKNNTIVEYKGYVLDFSNYNEKSVEIVLKHSHNMINWMALAC